MRIFLSYAAEYLALADQVNAALGAEGHEVFFAREDIPAATPFGRAIRAAVRRSDLFLYLVSPESVAPGSYCLTELGFAKERWPNPAGRVLPVVIAATSPEAFPPYVQSVSALFPEGNLAAEVVASIERLGREHRRSLLRSHPLAIAALCVAGGLGVWGWSRAKEDAATRPYLDVGSLVEVRPAVAGEPALAVLRGNVRNPSPHIDSIIGLDLDLDGGPAKATTVGAFEPILLDGDGGANFEQEFRLSPAGDGVAPPRRWRICVTPGGRTRRVCQPWAEWSDSALSVPPPLPVEQRLRSRVVASGPSGFLVGLANPAELLTLPRPGAAASSTPLPGEPTAIVTVGQRIAIGTRAPGKLVLLGPGAARSVYDVPGGNLNGTQVSTGVVSVALTKREAWVITGGSDGEAAVRLLDLASGRWVTLPYADDRFKFDPRGIRLRAGASETVWGVSTATIPSSVYRISRARVQEIEGHKVPAVSCTRDLLPAEDGTLFVMTCDGDLLQGRPRGGAFTTIRELDLRLRTFTRGDWKSEWIAGAADTFAVALTVLKNDSSRTDQVPLVSRIRWSVPGRELAVIGFERDRLMVTSLAARGAVALATVRSVHGVNDMIEVRLRAR
jgi:TIR domain-containing protein